MINSMAKVLKNGLMEANMKEDISVAKSTEKGNLFGLMEALMMEILLITIFMDQELIAEVMEENI